MSRIDDLIAEHCPDGVEYRTLDEIFTLKNGYTPSRTNATYWANGSVPWFRMEDIRANGRILDDSLQKINPVAVKGDRLFPANSLLIATSATVGEHALITVPHLSNQRFTSLTLQERWKSRLDMTFMFYYGFVLSEWCKANVTTSSFASVDMAGFRQFRIPVPPLEVQREIVRILDTFSALEAELEAELEARRTQYAYYRDELLTFGNDVEWSTLGSLGDFYGGLTGKTKADFQTGSARYISYMNVFSNLTVDQERNDFVSVSPGERQNIVTHGDILFTGSSESREEAGMSSVVTTNVNEPLYLNSFCIGYRFKNTATLIPDFSKHLFRSQDLRRQIIFAANGVTRFNVSKSLLAKAQVPIPPLAEQERIVEILDRFDALVNDLSIGLPAELAARRKQYEHYRDRLLAFRELAS